MTNEDPDILCYSCAVFDYLINRKNIVCPDILFLCHHHYEWTEEEKKKFADLLENGRGS